MQLMADNIIMLASRLKYYGKIWWLMSRNSVISILSERLTLGIFFVSKIVRFSLFGIFLFFVLGGTNGIAGYSRQQALFFFATFNVVEVISQFLFREVYRFRSLIVSGDFDLVLVRPMNPLFRALLGGMDFIDFATIPPLVIIAALAGSGLAPSGFEVVYYGVLVLNGIVISAAIYTVVLALGILTTEVDQSVMIFRDLANLGRLPIDIYREPLQSVITFVVPIGVMYTLPPKALFGFVSPALVALYCLLGLAAFVLSYKFWQYAIRKYASASS